MYNNFVMHHHATLIVDTRERALLAINEDLRTPSLDVVHYCGNRMGIDDVHVLMREATLTPFIGTERTFVLMYEDITREAQNALLKLFEEPPLTARFLLVVQNVEVLIPTLLSRMMRLETIASPCAPEKSFDFFKKTYAERLTYVDTLVKAGDMEGMHALFVDVEQAARVSTDVETIREVVFLKKVFNTPGASKKMILEHLSLSLSEKT